MKIKYTGLIVVVMVSSLLLISCAGKKKVQPPPKDPGALYTEGIVLFNKGKYKEAIKVFTQLKNYFPTDELYAIKADLRIADCYFFRKEYPEAIVRYGEFKKQHPFHPDVPYVTFQIGLSYYRQILSKDRDQEATGKALTAFQNVVSNYPDTIFARKAKEKIAFCRRRLSEHELCVAKFYLRKNKYHAAARRSSLILERYPSSGIDDEVLYCLCIALHKQKRDPEALTHLALLVRDYPQSRFAEKGKKLLASLKAEGVIAVSPGGEEGKMIAVMSRGERGRENVPFRISAKHTEEMPENNTIMYTGDVVALGEDVTIRSESLLLTMAEEGVPKEMVAMGEVRVKARGEEIFCKKAVWSPKQQLLVMTKDAKIRRPGEWIRGDEIILHLDTGRIKIKGKTVEKLEDLEGR